MGRSEKKQSGVVAGKQAEGGAEVGEADTQIDAAERLSVELARLRAKFGADPAASRISLEDAWMSPPVGMEEDEAEFVDAVADCLGAGLSLDAALTCWNRGELLYDANDDEADETAELLLPLAAAHHSPATGRRLIVDAADARDARSARSRED